MAAHHLRPFGPRLFAFRPTKTEALLGACHADIQEAIRFGLFSLAFGFQIQPMSPVMHWRVGGRIAPGDAQAMPQIEAEGRRPPTASRTL